MNRKLGALLLFLLTCSPAFAAGVGIISGHVTDSAGNPQMGAVVEIFVSAATLGTTVFTDSKGNYEAANLPPGRYQVKVSAVSFLPSLQQNVKLNAGAHVLINLTLTTLADALKLLPPRRTASSEPDDWHWTLRSAANRPVLRALEKDAGSNSGMVVVSGAESADSGSDGPVKARLAFIAGSQAQGFGSAGDMTTAFALEKSLFSAGMLSLNGNIGGSSADPAGVIRASYAHNLGDAARPAVAVTYRRFAAPGAAVENSPFAALEVKTSDAMSLAGLVDLQYGADLQSLEFARRVMALRPYGAIQVHISPDFVLEYRYSTAEPDSRAAKGFDTAPADFSESGPRMALANGAPEIELAQHQEVSASRRFGKTSLQVACYLDHVRNPVVTGAGDPSAYSDDVLPDVFSGTFSYAFSGSLNTTGARVVVERRISDQLTATVDYSTGGVVTADSPATWQNLQQSMSTSRQHSVGAKFAGYVPISGTRWIASYKWTSGNTLSTVDAFNASPGQMDPFFSVFIRQPLPSTGLIPAKLDALLDLRNLLAQGYMPVLGQDGRTIYMVQSARALRGGLAFTF